MMEEQKRQEELQALKQDIFESLHCALPGTVVSFDAETQTAVIRPAVVREVERQGRFSRSRDGTARSRPFVPLPLLRDVPVFMPVPFEVNPGDACLVVFTSNGTGISTPGLRQGRRRCRLPEGCTACQTGLRLLVSGREVM